MFLSIDQLIRNNFPVNNLDFSFGSSRDVFLMSYHNDCLSFLIQVV